MNRVDLIGRITADPEVRYMKNEDQTAYVSFILAISREYDREKADFIRCKAFGRTAEVIGDYTFKGSQIGISGRWETGSYETKDGDTVYTNECRVDRMELLGSKREEEKEDKRDDRKRSRR